MKSPYISELQPNQAVTGAFLVHSKEVRQKRNGEPYLSLLIGDRTGEVDAKMWDNVADVLDAFDRDDCVRVKGLLSIYQNRPQLTIYKVQRLDESEVDPSDFFPVSERDLGEMFAEVQGIIAGIGNPHLKALLEAVFGDPQVARLYRRAPAAKFVHHAYLGGLIEHVLSLSKLARFTAAHYAGLDLDLLLAGVLLHDVGKIFELSYDRSFAYTSEGQLLGHITIGIRMIEEKLRTLPDFPPRLARAGRAHGAEPPWPARVRFAQDADVPRSDAAPLPGRSGFQDGVHALADRAGPAGGRRVDQLQPAVGAQPAEEAALPGGQGAQPPAPTRSPSPRRPRRPRRQRPASRSARL